MTNLKDRRAPDIVSTPRRIIGSTTINHEVRVKLGISCDEYALMDFYDKFHKASKPISYIQIYEHIGFEKEYSSRLISELFHISLLEIYTGVSSLKPSEQWYQAFGDMENEFEIFWKAIDVSIKGVVKHIGWTGSKQDALQKFAKARKEESFEYLLKQKKDYFTMIASSSYRQVMGCSVFLNVTTKRYAEDWTKYDKSDSDHKSTGKKQVKVDKERIDKAF